MLETKGLVKIYKPKKGVPVRALDGVTLKFPDKGMVFLLGKSGSGKSTLLNLLGGLDKYDEGEIIIKNVSSKDFKQKHFDSYRNTYVGFIFQEYNVLDDFTVGANIALAIELQGKKATDEELNRILHEVDLDGYGNRRPNELSGGQKQRVAIARALVKNPKIIMADEPTGALDSVTGRQVLDTLKKLSSEKLVIVVSHDREFAMNYADRIIELADGKIISDTSFDESSSCAQEGLSFDGATAKIPMGYHLTEEDRLAINEYIDKLGSGAELSFEKRSDRKFVPTAEENVKSEDVSPFALIKSKLSLKHAFKIGSSGLKHKKFRLVMTIFLSCIAFVLFGLVDTFSAYDHINTSASSISDSNIGYASITKKQLRPDGKSYAYEVKISDADLEAFEKATGVKMSGVLSNYTMDLSLSNNLEIVYDADSQYPMHQGRFEGVVEITESDMSAMGYTVLAGRIPDGAKNEIAISKYMLDAFIKSGYKPVYLGYYPPEENPEDMKNPEDTENLEDIENPEDINKDEKTDKIAISSADDMLGKTLLVQNVEYTVVGIIDTHLDTTRYASLFTKKDKNEGDDSNQILDYVLYTEFRTAIANDFTGMMMTGKGFIDRYNEKNGNVTLLDNAYLYYDCNYGQIYAGGVTTLDKIKDMKIFWVDGERAKLNDNEIIISMSTAETYLNAVTFDEYGERRVDTAAIAEMTFKSYFYGFLAKDQEEIPDVKVVGVLDLDYTSYTPLYEAVVISDGLFNKYFASDGVYNKALGAMPKDRSDVKDLVEFCYTDHDGIKYSLNNPASFELDNANEVIEILAKVFLYVGLFFVVFASILLSNFIATSISYKKQEIGILRAIGSRGNDVFRIFFAEAFIIAMINFVLACIGTGVLTFVANLIVRNEVGLLITMFNFGIRQVAILFVVSIAVAAIASFFPVKRVASKRPIDAIRNR